MIRGLERRTVLLVMGWLAFVPAGHAQPAAPLDIDDLLTAPTFSPFSVPAISPDGKTIAYVVVDKTRQDPAPAEAEKAFRTAIGWAALGADIWIGDLQGGQPRNLTAGRGSSFLPSWSPDGQRLAFISDRDSPVARVWIWDRRDDRFSTLGDLPLVLSQGDGLQWTPDGRRLVVKLRPQNLTQSEYIRRVTGDAPQEEAPKPGATTVKVYSFDPSVKGAVPQTNQGNPDSALADLALVDVTGGQVERICTGQRIVFHALSPDGRKLGWLSMKGYEKPGTQQVIKSIHVYDLSNKKTVDLVTDAPIAGIFNDSRFSWSPRSDAVAYQTGGPRGGAKDAVFLATLDGAKRQVAEGRLEEVRDGNLYWAGSGDYLIFVRNGELWRAAVDGSGAAKFAGLEGRRLRPIEMGTGQWWSANGREGVVFSFDPRTKRTGLAGVDLRTGATQMLFEEDKQYGGYRNGTALTPDRKSIVFVAEGASQPRELWIAAAQARAKPRALTQLAAKLSQMDLGRTGLIEWRSIDGETLRGALIYPAGYQAGKRYPMLVKVYGGSDVSNDLFKFGFGSAPVDNLQLFASRGYLVLLADSRLHVGTPMFDLLKSVLPGVDKAVELGLADPDRIGITGHSYGGYSTLCLIVQTTRFKAAMASASVGDLVAAYGTLRPDGTNYLMSWAETGQGRMGGTIWDYRERYLENSPVHYLDRVTTPLLLINGAEDIAPTLADQVFSSLRRLGKRVEYARYAGEDHWEGSWSLANQRDYLQRAIAWFDFYLKGTTATGAVK